MDFKVDEERSDYLERGALKKYIKENRFDLFAEVADAQTIDWQNDTSTLVLRLLPGYPVTFDDGTKVASLAWEFRADHFDSMVEDYVTYYRFWWD